MKLWLIDIIQAINTICNLVFLFWLVFLSTGAFKYQGFPSLKRPYLLSFLFSAIGTVFIPSKEALKAMIL